MIQYTKISLMLITSVILVTGSLSYAKSYVPNETALDKLSITVGGRLYDRWWSVLQKDEPTSAHPNYPAEGKEEGADTWRCASCHGWDYKGADGVIGVFDMQGADPVEIQKIIRDETHQYTSEQLTDKAVEQLANFISVGLVDMDKYVDKATMTIKGNPKHGEEIFEHVCAICHGDTGKGINFSGDNDNPEYIGTVANNETLLLFHRIRNGMPGQPMVSLITLSTQTQTDVMAYEKTLPVDDNDPVMFHETHEDEHETGKAYFSEESINSFIKLYSK